jgi:hypothetical protein
MSHTCEVQSSFSVHGPTATGARQLPALQEKPLRQSPLERQLPRQPVPSPTQIVLPGQGALAAAQVPAPSQLEVLSRSPEQALDPHAVSTAG